MPTRGRTRASENSKPADDHRPDAEVTIAPGQRGATPSHAEEGRDWENTTALQRIERAACRLRSAEAQVKDQRRALEDEIERAIEATLIPIDEMARVAGRSRAVVYDLSGR